MKWACSTMEGQHGGVNVEFEAEKDISRMRGAETGMMMMMMDEDMPIESRKVNSFLGKVKKFVRR